MKPLIDKYLNDTITDLELERLGVLLQKKSNQIEFETYLRDISDTNTALQDIDYDQTYKSIMKGIIENQKPIRRIYTQRIKYGAAAILIGILVTCYIFRDNFFNDNNIESITPIIVNTNAIVPGTDKATLTLGDGSIVVLEKGNTYQGQNANSNGEEIVYEASKQKPTEIVYNYLTIPRGGEYYIVLSDGTRVWLNSESQLKYPENFIEGETREVELVYGEAYFDVSPSTEHKGTNFKVFNRSQEVEVLGTEFNIKAYKDETNIYTTLVEGKVVVGNSISKQNLIPNQQSNLDTKTNSITVAKVDVKGEISWKYGVFSFIDKPLKEIMKVISRWYNVDVVFENKELESVEFIGLIDRRQSIEGILSIMKSSSINNYKIKDKTIILK